MRKVIPFKTTSGFSYIYSPSRKQFLFSHPLIIYFLSARQSRKRWSSMLQRNSEKSTVNIKGSGTFSKPEFKYYLRKFRFLKKHGYFRPAAGRNLDGTLSPFTVTQNLSLTKQIIFETTEECNLDCIYCTYSKYYFNKERARKHIDTGDAIRLLDLILNRRNLTQARDFTVSFYGGEPLLNFRFIETIVNHMKNSNRNGILNLKFSMSTNGLLLKKYIGFLTENDFELAISLDGDEFSNSFRILKGSRKPSYNLVRKNIDEIKAKYPDYFAKRVIFLTVRHNRNSLKSIYDFFSDRYGKTPIMSSITTTGVVDEFRDEFRETFLRRKHTEHDKDCYLQELFIKHPGVAEIYELVERNADFIFRKPKSLLKSSTKNKDSRKYIPTASCSPFELRLYMNAAGGIYPCEHVSRFFELGVMRDNLLDLDETRISDTYNRYFSMIRKLCNSCYLSENCKECIFNTGVETAKPVCEYYTDIRKFAFHLSETFSLLEKENKLFARIRDEAYA